MNPRAGQPEPRTDSSTSSMLAKRRSRARDSVRMAEPRWSVASASQHRGERRSGPLANHRAREHVVAGDSREIRSCDANASSCRAQSYDYLRVQRVDGGPPLAINRVVAEQVGAVEEIEPVWFMATMLTVDDPKICSSIPARCAPVTYARLRLPQDNSSVRVTLHSRDDGNAPWSERWSGERYRIVTDTQRRESPPAHFASTTDRYWRVSIAKDPQLYRATMLELGYRPGAPAIPRTRDRARSRWRSAAGVRRSPGPARCDALLADVGSDDARRWSAKACRGSARARRRQRAATVAAPDAGATGGVVDGAGRRRRPAGRNGAGAAQAGSEVGLKPELQSASP